MEDRVIKKLLAMMKCEHCGEQYDAGNINVLGHREDMWFLKAFCPSCRTECLVAAVIKRENVCNKVSDLTTDEIKKFKHTDTVGTDDVLSMHRFLKNFDGDFADFFERESA